MKAVWRAMVCLALAILIVPSQCLKVVAQTEKERPQIDVKTLRQLGLTDMNDPGTGGSPLPAPPTLGSDTTAPGTLVQLCLKLKASGASPDFCK
jgi:hypothetical protein